MGSKSEEWMLNKMPVDSWGFWAIIFVVKVALLLHWNTGACRGYFKNWPWRWREKTLWYTRCQTLLIHARFLFVFQIDPFLQVHYHITYITAVHNGLLLISSMLVCSICSYLATICKVTMIWLFILTCQQLCIISAPSFHQSLTSILGSPPPLLPSSWKTPPVTSLKEVKTAPSCWREVEWGGMEPGVMPPMSAWCPLLATKNTGLLTPFLNTWKEGETRQVRGR